MRGKNKVALTVELSKVPPALRTIWRTGIHTEIIILLLIIMIVPELCILL